MRDIRRRLDAAEAAMRPTASAPTVAVTAEERLDIAAAVLARLGYQSAAEAVAAGADWPAVLELASRGWVHRPGVRRYFS